MVNDDLNANSVLEKYDRYSYEYERRFISSIGVFAAAGFAFCFTSSRFTDDIERFLEALLPSLWGFLLALVLSGVAPWLKSLQYRKLRDSIYSSESAKVISVGPKDDNSLLTREMKAKALLNFSDKDFKKHQYWLWASRTALVISALSLVFALSWPLVLLSTKGYI